jgi:hypothetical protein
MIVGSAIYFLCFHFDAILNGYDYIGYIHILLSMCSLSINISSILLFKWKKIGFWVLACMIPVISIFSMLFAHPNILTIIIIPVIFGGIPLCIFYAILQIKKDGVSCWKNLK